MTMRSMKKEKSIVMIHCNDGDDDNHSDNEDDNNACMPMNSFGFRHMLTYVCLCRDKCILDTHVDML